MEKTGVHVVVMVTVRSVMVNSRQCCVLMTPPRCLSLRRDARAERSVERVGFFVSAKVESQEKEQTNGER